MLRNQIRLIKPAELAVLLGYKSASPVFRRWCDLMGITPVPGRRDVYDPALVRRRLDEAQGLIEPDPDDTGSINLIRETTPLEQRKLRKAMESKDKDK